MTPLSIMLIVALVFVTGMYIRQYRRTPTTMGELNARLVGASRWFDKAHPLWLPPGTVRALIVIMAMWGILFPVVKLVAWEGTLDPAVKDILLVLLGALPGFINKYMEVRTDK